MLGTAPLPVLDMTKKRSYGSAIKIVKRDSRSVKLVRFSSPFATVYISPLEFVLKLFKFSFFRDWVLEELPRELYRHCILFLVNKQMKMLTWKIASHLCVMLERWRRMLTVPVAKVLFVNESPASWPS